MYKQLIALTFMLLFATNVSANAQEIKNGRYKSSNSGLLEISEASQKSFKFNLNLSPSGIDGGTALLIGKKFKFSDKDLDCSLIFSFTKDSISINQEGSCGFGMGQVADGSYKRVK